MPREIDRAADAILIVITAVLVVYGVRAAVNFYRRPKTAGSGM